MSRVKANTPMMKQFNAAKAAYPDCIIFFQAGDFYEMFGEDAERASEILNISLTTRHKNSPNAVPMCGVPIHSYENYLPKLTAAGVKVAICNQTEEASQAKGLVRREVVRVVTPGTTLSTQLISDGRNNFLAALEMRPAGKPMGIALADLSTGQFDLLEIPREPPGLLWSLLMRERPRELLLPEPRNEREAEIQQAFAAELRERMLTVESGVIVLEEVASSWFDPRTAKRRLTEHFETTNLAGFGVEHLETALRAGGALLAYLGETQKCDLSHIARLGHRTVEQSMWLDEATLTHLEIFENRSPGGARHTLLGVLNHTRTPMGARLLRGWLGQPLLEGDAIEERLAAVEEMVGNPTQAELMSHAFAGIRDLERTIARVSLPVAGIADVVALRDSLAGVQQLPAHLEPWRSPLLAEIARVFDPMSEVHEFLQRHFKEEPSLKLAEGGYIARGISDELDQLHDLAGNSKEVLKQLESRERAATGIPSLKVRFNKVFGYYLEISRIHQAKIPESYIRKQTLVNAERYTTLELEEIEEQLLGAEEKIAKLEREEFQRVRTILKGYVRRLQITASQIARLDVLAGLAEAARRNGYVRPRILPSSEPRRLEVRGGRHPVLELIDPEEPFVPNDLELDQESRQIALITGPNMAGKSTVMRQMALIQLMAQSGSFVPAKEANLSLVDRIFTRVGASDNLSRGQSTFMMEMNEAANILNNASPQSLLVLDEIGRGTSTYDGISIAWAIMEHLHQLGALTLFATHYHELTQLARELPRVKNFNISIEEEGERLVFPRKLSPGEADKSYGIQVAQMAGLPKSVIRRAHEVMDNLAAGSEGAAVVKPAGTKGKNEASTEQAVKGRQQLSFLTDSHPLLEKIRALEPENITPREALELLFQMRADLKDGKD